MRKRQIMAAANEDARPLTEPLETKQQEAIDGPEPDMSYFVCSSCNTKYLDMKSYFFDIKSNKCLWCTKFPKTDERKTN